MGALRAATELARSEDARLVIAHVEERSAGRGGVHVRAGEADTVEELRDEASKLNASGIETKLEITSTLAGDTAALIREIAEDDSADLIVVGSRGRSRLARGILGGVARRLLSISPVPVLILPEVAMDRLASGASHSFPTAR